MADFPICTRCGLLIGDAELHCRYHAHERDVELRIPDSRILLNAVVQELNTHGHLLDLLGHVLDEKTETDRRKRILQGLKDALRDHLADLT